MIGEPPVARNALDHPELWLVDLRAASAALRELESETARLARDDEERLARVADEETRTERRSAHIALRLLIERAFGPAWRRVAFVRSSSGKPSLPESGGAFSLSHVEGCALIGIAPRGTIGVDIERYRPIRISEERRRAIEVEAEARAGSRLPETGDARFFQAWVRLEAIAKAEGTGIGSVLTRAGVGQQPTRAPQLVPLSVHDVATGGDLAAAVALSESEPLPPLQHLPDSAEALQKLLLVPSARNR